jgi:hypothetical protein
MCDQQCLQFSEFVQFGPNVQIAVDAAKMVSKKVARAVCALDRVWEFIVGW